PVEQVSRAGLQPRLRTGVLDRCLGSAGMAGAKPRGSRPDEPESLGLAFYPARNRRLRFEHEVSIPSSDGSGAKLRSMRWGNCSHVGPCLDGAIRRLVGGV